jgi:hypothetical protein
MQRTDIINELIARRGFTSYLEIGVRDVAANFNHIRGQNKVGVDPSPDVSEGVTHLVTSDVFFANNVQKFDLVFIDGLHTEEQVGRDIDNALKALNPGGVIVVHDALPPTAWHQRDHYDGQDWTGTGWKAVAKAFATSRSRCYVVDGDWGCAVIDTGSPVAHRYAPETPLDYDRDFPSFRQTFAVTPEQFTEGLSTGPQAKPKRVRMFVWTPGHIAMNLHTEMVRVQSLVARRLRRAMPDVEFVHALVCDRIDEPQVEAVREIGKDFDQFHHGIPPEYGQAWGIRKPTHYALDLARAAGCSHMLRVIQDTFIMDVAKFAADVGEVLKTPGDWLGANRHDWETDGHRSVCEEMGIPLNTKLRYPNGAVMVAPLATWQRFYVPMPARINHYWDDIIMGEWMLHAGATLVDLPTTWAHLHDSRPEVSRSHYEAHAAELATHPT